MWAMGWGQGAWPSMSGKTFPLLLIFLLLGQTVAAAEEEEQKIKSVERGQNVNRNKNEA